MEIETAKLHGGWAVWKSLPTEEKAELLAHELHKKMREHYEYDLRMDSSAKATEGRSSSGKNNFLSNMRDKFLGGGKNKYA